MNSNKKFLLILYDFIWFLLRFYMDLQFFISFHFFYFHIRIIRIISNKFNLMKILCFNKLLTAKVQKTNQFIKYRSINLFVSTDSYSRSP